MPKSEVTPKKEVFQEYLSERSIQWVSDHFDCAEGTVRKLRDGIPVSRKVIRNAALAMGRPVRELIEPDKDGLIPGEVEFFTSLRFGYFIDNDRRGDGEPCWYSEAVELNRVIKGGDARLIHFAGHIINQFDEKFVVEGVRLNGHHFAITGVSEVHGWSFDASFTIRSGDVLCGTWSGVNYLENSMAIYRMFVSKNPLSPDDLERLTREQPIDPVFRVKRNVRDQD